MFIPLLLARHKAFTTPQPVWRHILSLIPPTEFDGTHLHASWWTLLLKKSLRHEVDGIRR